MLVESFRTAYRSLRLSRGFFAAAVLSIAVGIGANVTIFSLLNAVVLKPLDYPSSDRLVAVTQHDPVAIAAFEMLGLCPIQFETLAKGNTLL